VRVIARRALPVHLDAEPFGHTPARFHVAPASLRLLVPPTAPQRLFRIPPGAG
jgi:diacylglycerol kinase family enzyme